MFLTGACVLIVEVLAVRVFSPYYGNTIFTVSSVISVILLALSVGYYAGGVAADRRPSRERFFGLILASGAVLLLLHLVGRLTLPAISAALSIQAGPLVSASLMFLLPALLLGMVSPYAIKLQSLSVPQQGVGSVAGTIFFWSTLGSISGSLLAGFVLIPAVGVDRVLIAVGVLLVLLGCLPLVILRLATTKAVAPGAAAVVLALAGAQFAAEPVVDAGTVVYQSDGLYQQITIYEGQYLGRPARFLLLDRSESGAMFLDSTDPADLVYDYTKYYSLYKVFTPQVRNALVLGGGAYSIPKALLHELPEAVIDVAEIEPSFLDLAKKYFGAADSPRLRNYVEDGRRFLRDSDTQYDLIFGDVYYSYFSVPPQFTTREFFALAKSRLRGEGVFIANMIGDLSRREPSLIMAEIRTFQTVFPNSYFFAVESAERTDQLQNITLVGYNSERQVDVTRPPVTTHPDDLIRFLRYKTVDVARRFELSPYPVLTDDFSPVEYLTARVLGRAFDQPTETDGDEMGAVADQVLRYTTSGPRIAGDLRLREFLAAEMNGLSAEVTITDTTISAGLFLSEDVRTTVAARMDDAAAVGVLVETARSLIFSPVPPAGGVDVLFFAEGSAPPPGALVLSDICPGGAAASGCGAQRLASEARRLLDQLRAGINQTPVPNSQSNPYQAGQSWGQLPAGRPYGNTSAVHVDARGNVWVADKCASTTCTGRTEDPILAFDSSGRFLRSFGSGLFVFPHGIHVDTGGNVWVTDGQGAEGKGHQVFKFSAEGKVLLTLGTRGVAGTTQTTFNQPSDVVVAPNGDIFVADGHGGESNARIVKFSTDGRFLKTWGRKGTGPGEFDVPHALAMDSQGRLFVGDRGNSRIQIFDQEGAFLAEWRQFGRPSGIFIDDSDTIYVTDSESNPNRNPEYQRGLRVGSARDGSVSAFVPIVSANPAATAGGPEGIAADANGTIYGAETGGRDIKRYVKSR